MPPFSGLLARLKSPRDKQQDHRPVSTQDNTADAVEEQDLPQPQAEEPSSTGEPPHPVSCQLHSSDPHQQVLAVQVLCSSTCEDPTAACTHIYTSGLVPRLVELLSSPSPAVQIGAAASLGNVLSAAPPSCSQAAAAGAVPVLIQLMASEQDDLRLQRYAVGALESIVDNADPAAAALQPAIRPLVRLLSYDDLCTQRRAAGCLWSVVRHDEEAREAAVASGAVEGLAQQLRCAVAIHHANLLRTCLLTLSILAPGSAAKRALLQTGCIPLLVDLVATAPCPELQQLAAVVLHNSVVNDTTMAEAVAAAQAAQPLVALLSTDTQVLQRLGAGLLEVIADEVEAFRADILAAGAVPLLVQLVKSCEDGKVQERVAGLLWTLCSSLEGRSAIREAGGVQALERLRCDREDPATMRVATGALKALRHVEQAQAAEACAAGNMSLEPEATSQVSVTQRVAELSSTDGDVRRAAVADLGYRTSQDTTTSIQLRTEGAMSRIVQLLEDSDTPTAQAATALLGNVLVDDPQVSSVQAVAEGALHPLMAMVANQADPKRQTYAVGALSVIASNAVEAQPLMRQTVVQPLVDLLGSKDSTTQLRACNCLAVLSLSHPPTLMAIRKAGGIPLMTACLSSSRESLVDVAAAALGNVLAEDITSRTQAVAAGAVPVLVGLLSRDSGELQSYAAGCLACIAETSGTGRMAALQAGAVDQLIQLASSSSSSASARERACMAREHLKTSWTG